MSELIGAVTRFFRFLWSQKAKLALIPLFALLWVPFLFPYSDLRSVIATTVSRSLGEGVAIDFDSVSLAAGFPVALSLQNLEVNAPGLPPVNADHLVASPSIGSLITQSPGGSVRAQGLYGGDVAASLSSGAKLKSGQRKQEINADISGMDLEALTTAMKKAGSLSFVAKGTVDSQIQASVDPTMDEQPVANLSVNGQGIQLPTISLSTPMGPLLTPSLELSKLDFRGKMAEGKLQIEELVFGQGKDSLSGRVRGEVAMQIRADESGRRTMVPGAYDLRIELNFGKPLMDTPMVGIAMSLAGVDKAPFKSVSPTASKYAFRLKGTQIGVQPMVEPLTGN